MYDTPGNPADALKRQIRARLLAPEGAETPSAPAADYQPTASYLPATPRPGTYALSEIGNATVDRDAPAHPVRDRILGIADAALHGLAAAADPEAEGFAGQVGSFARGYSATTDLVERNRRERLAERIAAQTAQQETDLRRAQTNYYNAGVPLRDAQAKAALSPKSAPLRADDWVPLLGNPGSPALQQNRATGDTKPVLGPDGKPTVNRAKPTPTPRTPAEHYQVGADGIARRINPRTHKMEVILDENGQPFRPRVSGRQGNGLTPRAGASSGAKPSAADRWDTLVHGGMDEAAATAKVHQELRSGLVTP